MSHYKLTYRLCKVVCCYLFIGLLFSPLQAVAQTESKQVSKTLFVEKDCNILITGKKADITVSGWDKDSVKVKIDVYFSHDNKDIAKKEIKYASCNIAKTGSAVNINNNFLVPAGVENIQSLVRVTYNIKLPHRRTVIINNSYGACSIKQVNGYFNIHNDYGNITMTNVDGFARIFSTLSKISAENIGGEFEFDTKNTEYFLKNINGTVSIENNIGNIEVKPGTKLQSLTIDSPGGEVNLKIQDLNKYDFDFQTKYAKVMVAEGLYKYKFEWEPKKIINVNGDKPLIKISTKFNNINIKP